MSEILNPTKFVIEPELLENLSGCIIYASRR